MRPFKQLLFFVICSFWSLNSSAQYDIHVNSGINISNFSWTSTSEFGWNYKKHYFLGAVISKPLNSLLSVQGNLQYSQKGNGGTNPNLTLHYIDFLPAINFQPIKHLGYSLGINTGFLLNSDKKWVDSAIDLGMHAGVNFQFGKVQIHGHYNHGLWDLERDEVLPSGGNIQAHNSTFQIGVGYKIYTHRPKNNLEENRDGLIEPSPKLIDLGVRFRSLNSFDFIFKKELSATKYSRLRVVSSNLIFARNKTNHRYTWQAGIAAGIENRKELDDNLDFIHGIEPSLSLSYSKNGDNFDLAVNPAIGYILGLYYSKSSQFRFGLEAIPSIGMSLRFDQGGLDPDWFLNAGISNTSIALVATYTLKNK